MSINNGWIKVFRCLIEKGWYKKSDYKSLWIHLLLKANHKEQEYFFNGENIILKPGQMVTGRKKLSLETGINESKIERILNFFEKNEHQIEQQKSNKNRLITIVNWHKYQGNEQQIEQQVNNKWTTSEQQVNTNKNDKKEKKEKKNEYTASAREIIDYLNQKTGKKFKYGKPHLDAIIPRLKEGNTVEDCKKVIDVKASQWLNTENDKYLRPETLFRASKFDGYLNEREFTPKKAVNNMTVSDDFSFEEGIEEMQRKKINKE